MAQLPTQDEKVFAGGQFGIFRPKQGPSGTWHWGVDMVEPQGSPVFAPERMTITHVWHDDSTAPFVGYGPSGILARALDGPVGLPHYHLLGHLDPAGWSDTGQRLELDAAGNPTILGVVLTPTVGEVFEQGQQVGTISNLGHTHWEIRKEPIDSPETRKGNTYDPLKYVHTGNLVMVDLPDPSSDWGWVFWVAAIWLLSRG
jgi:hypothetical protein